MLHKDASVPNGYQKIPDYLFRSFSQEGHSRLNATVGRDSHEILITIDTNVQDMLRTLWKLEKDKFGEGRNPPKP